MQHSNQKLRELRQLHKLTMEQASEKIGVSAMTYSRWESGKQKPGLRHLRELCELFQITPEELGYTI